MPSFRVNVQWAAMSQVAGVSNLYIAGVTALRPDELTAAGITMIVNCTAEVPNLNVANMHRIKLWLQVCARALPSSLQVQYIGHGN
jgi:hypothetical protein